MRYALGLTAMAAAICLGSSANAAPVLSSAAVAASVNITALNVVQANVQFAPVSGSAGAAYDNSANLISITQAAELVAAVLANGFTSANEGLTTGVVKTEAYSTLPNSATGTASIANADVGVTTKVASAIPAVAFGLTADEITSTTTAGINGAGLYATGSSIFTDLATGGTVLGILNLGAAANGTPTANDVIFNLLGLKITLNEQTKMQDATSISMSTNAIDIALDNYVLDGVGLYGNIILGHSEASVTGYSGVTPPGTPEPEAWALMIVGFGFIGQVLRQRVRLVPSPA